MDLFDYWDHKTGKRAIRDNVTLDQATRYFKDRGIDFRESIRNRLVDGGITPSPERQKPKAEKNLRRRKKLRDVKPKKKGENISKQNIFALPCCQTCVNSEKDTHALLQFHGDENTTPLRILINSNIFPLLSLLDSGALQGNYIRRDKGEELRQAGCSFEETGTHVCAAFGNCEKALYKISVNVEFNFQYINVIDLSDSFDLNLIKNLEHLKLNLDFLIVDKLPFEVIIGRKDMLKYSLWEKVIKPQCEIDLANTKSNNPKAIDTMAQPKPVSDETQAYPGMECNVPNVTGNSQKRKKRDSGHREEPKRVMSLTAPSSSAESWLITDSQALMMLSENNRPMNRLDKSRSPTETEDKWIRAHVSEVFNYEEEAEGIDLSDEDYPGYDWDVEILSPNLVGRNSSSLNENVKTSTNYIPTQIYGDEDLQAKIRQVCNKWKHIFHTTVGLEPADIPPMKLEVDHKIWMVNSNKGPPREQTPAKQAEVRKQVVEKMLPVNVVGTSQAEYYSQVHLVKKPVYATETVKPNPIPNPTLVSDNPQADPGMECSIPRKARATGNDKHGTNQGVKPEITASATSTGDVRVIKIDG